MCKGEGAEGPICRERERIYAANVCVFVLFCCGIQREDGEDVSFTEVVMMMVAGRGRGVVLEGDKQQARTPSWPSRIFFPRQ